MAVLPAAPRVDVPLFRAEPRVEVDGFRLAPRFEVEVFPAEPRVEEEVLRLEPRVEAEVLPADLERVVRGFTRLRPPVVDAEESSRSAGSPPITEPIVVSELRPPEKEPSADDPLRPLGFA